MQRLCICDDEKLWRDKACKIINQFAEEKGVEISLTCLNNAESVLEFDGAGPDYLFMDIEFGNQKTGIESVKKINQKFPGCQVIYVSNHIDYALDVYETNHVWFMLKSQFEERLPSVFDRANELDEIRKSEIVVRNTSGITVRLRCNDIVYIERKERKTLIVSKDSIQEVKERIPYVFEKLPAGLFSRCHNSFVVNLDEVDEIYSGTVRMKDGTELLISRSYNKTFRTQYMNWVQNKIVR